MRSPADTSYKLDTMNLEPAAHRRTPSLDYSAIHLAVVCPMANERATAEAFIRDVLAQCRRFFFRKIAFYAVIDLASRDDTYALLISLRGTIRELRVIFAPENRTVVDAYLKGYRAALDGGADWVLEIDAGFSHRPEDIPVFFETMAQGYDCVFATRFSHNGQFAKKGLWRWAVSYFGTLITNALLGTRLHDMTSGFELFTRDALTWILQQGIRSRGPFFQTEIKAFAHQLRITEVPITYIPTNPRLMKGALQDALIQLFRLYKTLAKRRHLDPTCSVEQP
jgi:dolichol-phosphate mannosyltransferase